jgi:hypothetical protein
VVPHFPAGALIGAKKNFDGANYVLLVLCGTLHASFGASDPRPRRTSTLALSHLMPSFPFPSGTMPARGGLQDDPALI